MQNKRSTLLSKASLALLLLVTTLFVGSMTTAVYADPVAFAVWDFEGPTTDPSVDLTGNAVASAGSALGGESFPIGNPDGTSGASWSFNNWSQTDAIDADRYFEFKVDLTDYENLNLSFAERRSGTGPLTFAIHYSTDGTTFTEIANTVTTLPNNTSWRSHSFDLSGLNSEIAGQASVQFRIYGYDASGSGGTWRIDDVTFTGDTDTPPTVLEFAVWDFEGPTTDPAVDLTGNAVASAGSALGSESFPIGNPAGTSGTSWSFNNWSVTSTLDADRYFEFKVDLSTFADISLSFAERRSGTGPLTYEIHYSIDGTTFTQIASSVTTLPNNTNWRSHSFDLSDLNSEIAGQSSVQFRIYGYGATGTGGTWRIDDVNFTGETGAPPPPPPSPIVDFAVWDFEGETIAPSVDLTGNAVASAGNLLGGESFPIGNPNGTSGTSWSFNNWAQSDAIDLNRYFEFKVDLSTYEDISLSFAERRSGTGPATFEIHYSTDGATFTFIPGTVTSLSGTGWRTNSFDLSGLNSEIAFESSVQFRIYGYNASAAGGTWRIDDVTFTGETSEAPPPPPPPPGGFCGDPFTPIYDIQGDGLTTPLQGQAVTTEGVVVGDFEGPSPNLRGFYIQDPVGDDNPETSDGIFVFNFNNDDVNLGELVRVSGTAGEFQGQTQISSVINILICATDQTVEPTDVYLPFPEPVDSVPYLERYEGMLVRLPQTLYVTEHFQLGRFGQIIMSSGDRLYQPTHLFPPGSDEMFAQQQANDLNRIIIDDELNNQNPDPIFFGRGGNQLTASNTLRGGDTAENIVGVMTFTWAGNPASGNAYRVRPINALGGGVPDFQATNPRPNEPDDVGGTMKVAAFNLLNYFNEFTGCTGGVGGASVDCRGARNPDEFDRQWPKTIEAILAMDVDILGVIEMQNNGYGPDSAIQDLVNRLNYATADGTYALIDVYAETGVVNAMGTDAIKVGLLYRPANVTPVGTTAVLNTPAFVTGGDGSPRNRPTLAQTFEQNSTGLRLIVNVHHLKAKGSPCDDPDQGDGQANCAIVRTNAALELMDWLLTDPTGTGETDILIIGDLNSYAQEDPIQVILEFGFVNLVEELIGPEAYSFVFSGQWGYLDYALASPSLAAQVTGVTEWNINADEPNVLDYSTQFKNANQQVILYAPDQFRSSDHDPIMVGLQLTYDFEGFFPPVNNAPEFNQSRAGRSIPIKFSLNGNWGTDIFLPGFPMSVQVDCETGAVIGEPVSTISISGLNYDPVSDQYNYVWRTDRSWSNSCRQFTLGLVDGSEHILLFRFR